MGHPKGFYPSSSNPNPQSLLQLFKKENNHTNTNTNTNHAFPSSSQNKNSISDAKIIDSSSFKAEAGRMDTSRLKEQMKLLSQQLEQTNEEISRQELKIALKTKTKSYERPIK